MSSPSSPLGVAVSSLLNVMLFLTVTTRFSMGFVCTTHATGGRHADAATATTTTAGVLTEMISKQQLGSFEALEHIEGTEDRKVALLDFTSSDRIGFEEAWEFQKDVVSRHVRRMEGGGQRRRDSSFLRLDDDDDPYDGCDTVIMLQHHPVYTLGTGSDEKFVLQSNDKVPVVRMDRGGEVTYHGPGQLTVYPILDLRSYRQDIHWYMRALEEAIILALSRCGLRRPAERQDDVTGVWVDDHKVAAVGIKCRKWITMHGLAVNVEESSLANFAGIVPCGLDGRKVGCVNQFVGGEPMTVQEFAEVMKEALEEVFRIRLVESETT